MSPESLKAVARGYLAAVAANDTAAIDRYVAPGYVRHDPGLPTPVLGPAGVKRHTAALHRAFPDFRIEEHDVVAERDRVLVRLTIRGSHRGEFAGAAPTGRAVAMEKMDLFRIAGGQVAEQWVAADALGLLRQLGVGPSLD